MIRISVAEMALNRAVSETAEEIATHIYPAVVLKGQAEAAADNYIQQKTGYIISLNEAKEILQKAMDAMGLKLSADKLVGNIATSTLTPYIEKKVKEQVGDTFLKDGSITVEKVNFTEGLGGALEIEAKLELPLFVPFVDQTVVLKKQAYEGLWSTL